MNVYCRIQTMCLLGSPAYSCMNIPSMYAKRFTCREHHQIHCYYHTAVLIRAGTGILHESCDPNQDIKGEGSSFRTN